MKIQFNYLFRDFLRLDFFRFDFDFLRFDFDFLRRGLLPPRVGDRFLELLLDRRLDRRRLERLLDRRLKLLLDWLLDLRFGFMYIIDFIIYL